MASTRSLAVACVLATAACAPRPSVSSTPNAGGATAAQQVVAIADDYLAGWRDAFPEVNTTHGIPGARHDRLSDNTAAAEQAWRVKEDRWLEQMKRIDPASLLGRPEWVTY
jgi:uncharacterized protein (DUF885 family)